MSAGMAGLVKVILMLVAALLFIIGAFSDTNWPEMIGIGLALVAIGLVIEELPGARATASGMADRR